MKTTLKSLFTISIILLTFFFSGCEKELYDEPIYQNNNQVTEKNVTLAELIGVIKDPTIKNYLNNLTKDISSNLGSRLTDEELLYFQKFVKENEYTSYTLRLNDFTADKPYFLDFVIKTDGITEKAGFIKYIPDETSTVFDARTFSGEIEVSNLNDHIVASNVVVNGVPTYSTNSFASIQCFSSMELVQHNCTHGGNHAPGESCDGPGGNDGYYELIITNFCLTFPEDLNFVAAPDTSMGGNTGSGGPELSAANIAYNFFTSNLITQDQAAILGTNQKLRDYLMANQVSNESQVRAVKMINYILQNEQSPESVLFISEVLDAVNQYYDEYGENPETKEIADNFLDSLFEEEGENIDDVVLLTPPDCNSFNFTSPSSTINWQQSAVQNIHFTVVVLSPNGVFVNHVIEYPTPILFGMPNTLTVGNTPISPGLAATLSAAALNRAMKETVKKFGSKPVSYMIVEKYFEDRLKHNFEIGIPGARLNLHPQSYPTPTQYQTNAIGLGNCQ